MLCINILGKYRFHEGVVNAVAFVPGTSSSGEYCGVLASASADSTIALWDVYTNKKS